MDRHPARDLVLLVDLLNLLEPATQLATSS
ncbi:hypothetical protein Q760_10295 [Cellulomonas cellasea DSM 20118]|uniref:Uncharacterized protein n=1 Tax=Cellulomonas cellasea DSM 20118 TaxID=1408250 RepID=A0A0A0BAI7_9CELL|nr:hypothetical protein Q760_10295 [Cellulomonas cellasea DSM 20118]